VVKSDRLTIDQDPQPHPATSLGTPSHKEGKKRTDCAPDVQIATPRDQTGTMHLGPDLSIPLQIAALSCRGQMRRGRCNQIGPAAPTSEAAWCGGHPTQRATKRRWWSPASGSSHPPSWPRPLPIPWPTRALSPPSRRCQTRRPISAWTDGLKFIPQPLLKSVTSPFQAPMRHTGQP